MALERVSRTAEIADRSVNQAYLLAEAQENTSSAILGLTDTLAVLVATTHSELATINGSAASIAARFPRGFRGHREWWEEFLIRQIENVWRSEFVLHLTRLRIITGGFHSRGTETHEPSPFPHFRRSLGRACLHPSHRILRPAGLKLLLCVQSGINWSQESHFYLFLIEEGRGICLAPLSASVGLHTHTLVLLCLISLFW